MRLLAGVLCVSTLLAPAAAVPGPDPASVVGGWKTSSVYVDPSQLLVLPHPVERRRFVAALIEAIRWLAGVLNVHS